MPTAAELFPRTFAVADADLARVLQATAIDLADGTGVWPLLVALAEFQNRIQENGATTATINRVFVASEAMSEDLRELQTPSTGLGHDLVSLARLSIAVVPLALASSLRRRSLVYDWIARPLAQGPLDPWGTVLETDALAATLRLAFSSLGAISEHAAQTLLEWCRYYWDYSRNTTALTWIGEWLTGALEIERFVRATLRARLHEYALAAAAALLAWQARFAAPSKALQAELGRLLEDPKTPLEQKKLTAILFSGSPGTGTPMPIVDRAAWTLRTFADTLQVHERLQLTVASLRDATDAGRRVQEIVAGIREHQTWIEQSSGDALSRAYERAGLYQLLGRVIKLLVESGRTDVLQRILAAWRHGGNPPPTPLLVFAKLDSGRWYAREGRAIQVAAPEPDELTAVVNATFGLTLLSGEPNATLAVPGRPQVPEAGMAADFEAAALNYLRPGALREDLPAPEHSALVVPTVPVAAQALWLRELGRTWPLIASFERAEPDRALRRALVCTTSDAMADVEGDAVAAVLEAAGITVDRLAGAVITKDQFLRGYDDPRYDLIWFAGHGEFDPFAPERSFLAISEDEQVHLADLIERSVPGDGRRLLVLNACEGAASLHQAGGPEIGFAASLAGARQAVISHAWPVHWTFALAFALLFARALSRRGAFFEAYVEAAALTFQGREAVLAALVGFPDPDIRERLQRGLQLEGILQWGAPTFMI